MVKNKTKKREQTETKQLQKIRSSSKLIYVSNYNKIYNQRKSKFLKIGRDQGFGKTTEEAYKSLSYKDSGIFGKIIDGRMEVQ